MLTGIAVLLMLVVTPLIVSHSAFGQYQAVDFSCCENISSCCGSICCDDRSSPSRTEPEPEPDPWDDPETREIITPGGGVRWVLLAQRNMDQGSGEGLGKVWRDGFLRPLPRYLRSHKRETNTSTLGPVTAPPYERFESQGRRLTTTCFGGSALPVPALAPAFFGIERCSPCECVYVGPAQAPARHRS